MKLHPMTLLRVSLSVAGALLLTSGASTHPYENELLEVAVNQSFGELAPRVAEEPLEIQALLLDYADNESLLLQARLALLKYPDLAYRILPIYGDKPEFQAILLNYGEAALPPIAYFMDHDLTSLEMRRALQEWLDKFQLLYGHPDTSLKGTTPPPKEPETDAKLTPVERGWYAIHFLQEEGHDLLGQFTISAEGTIEWVQTERVIEGVSDFFLGGIRGLEATWRQDEAIEGSDWGWAALDVVVIAGGLKLLRAVRAARTVRPAAATARAGGFSGRIARFGSGILAQGGRLGVSVAKLGAIPAAVYLMFRYPSLINATLAEFAVWLGIEPWLVHFVFWFIAICITLSVAAFLLRPLSWLFRALSRVTGALTLFLRAPLKHQRQIQQTG